MSLFIDHTKRSASELLADLAACRQFRHISADYRQKIIDRSFLAIAKAWMGPKAIKHPDPNNLCTNCGQPRSKYNQGGPGLCYRCYASEGVNIRDLWVEDVFQQAVRMRGFSCDACGTVQHFKEGEDDEARNAVIQMLDSLDGKVKPVLCGECTTAFKAYTSRYFGKSAWRHASPRDLEKMTLCWFALKVKLLAERKCRAA